MQYYTHDASQGAVNYTMNIVEHIYRMAQPNQKGAGQPSGLGDIARSCKEEMAKCKDKAGPNCPYFDLTTTNRLKFDLYGYTVPSFSSGGWAGVAGGSQAAFNGIPGSLVMAHEWGHNFGLAHSSFRDVEYGDCSSCMGNCNAGMYVIVGC